MIPKPGAEQPPKDPANQSANPPDTTQPPAPDATPAAATPDATPEGTTQRAGIAARRTTAAGCSATSSPSTFRTRSADRARRGTNGRHHSRQSAEFSLGVTGQFARALKRSRRNLARPADSQGRTGISAAGAAQHLEGPVVLQAWVARDGTVRDVKLVKGYFVLARAAFDAVKQWRFKPYSPNGKAIDFQTVLTLNFKYPN